MLKLMLIQSTAIRGILLRISEEIKNIPVLRVLLIQKEKIHKVLVKMISVKKRVYKILRKNF